MAHENSTGATISIGPRVIGVPAHSEVRENVPVDGAQSSGLMGGQ